MSFFESFSQLLETRKERLNELETLYPTIFQLPSACRHAFPYTFSGLPPITASVTYSRQGWPPADRGILVRTDKIYCSLNRAKIIQKIVQQEQPDMVLMGKQAIDDDNNQTPQMLAGLLNWPQITFISKLDMSQTECQASREIDQGLEILQCPLPAVFSTDLRLNEPRYASLPNIMKAKQKPLQIIELDSLNLNLRERTKVIQLKPPPTRPSGVILPSISALLDKLQHDEKVLS